MTNKSFVIIYQVFVLHIGAFSFRSGCLPKRQQLSMSLWVDRSERLSPQEPLLHTLCNLPLSMGRK